MWRSIGAGAAGIAAARNVAAAGKRYVLLEASDRIGGRCVTDVTTFGVPYDHRGAHWLHMPDINPVAKLAARACPGSRSTRRRPGRSCGCAKPQSRAKARWEDYLAAIVPKASRAIQEAARAAKGDISCAQALPKDLGDWKPAVDFVRGPFGCGKSLRRTSRRSILQRSAERDVDSFCRQGLGALLAKASARI